MSQVNYYFLAIPLIIEIVFALIFAVMSNTVYRTIFNKVNAHESAENAQSSYIDPKGKPTGKYGWVRVFELIFLIYHYPVIVLVAALKRDSFSSIAALIITPVVYAGCYFLYALYA